jgi:hypothetical protein
MPYVLGIVIVALLVVFVASRRKTKGLVSTEANTYQAYAIPATAEMLEEEKQDNDEVMRLLEENMRTSGLFRNEKIPELISRLRSGWQPFTRLNTKTAFGGDEVLSVEDKRSLGLNTRMKYSRTFIDYFDPVSLKIIEPKSILTNMHVGAFHRVSRRRNLMRFRSLGVKRVRIIPVGDGRDCDKIVHLNKVYELNDVPDLPLQGCNAPYCRCMYEPILSDSA